MQNCLIVGFDGAEESVSALRWTAAEAARRGASVRVVSSVAVEPMVDFGYGAGAAAMAVDDELLEWSGRRLAEACAEAFEEYPAVDHEMLVVRESPAAALLREAEQADLVVVGRTGAGAVTRFLLGSVTGSLLASSPCPVAIIPAAHAGTAGRVTVGVDGSEHADNAVRWAVDEADRRSSGLVVAHVWQHPFRLNVDGVGRGDPLAEVDAALVLDRAVETATELSAGEVRGQLIEAKAIDGLLEVMGSTDLLVVGSRGRGGFGSMLFGSAAHAVATQTRCPAVIVR